MKNVKRKGNNFEREMSKLLSNWYNKGKNTSELVFWRDLSSGNLSNFVENKNLCGDLICLKNDDNIKKLYFELKYYSNLKITEYNKILKFFKEVPGKIVYVILKNRKGIFIFSKYKIVEENKINFFLKQNNLFCYSFNELYSKFDFDVLYLKEVSNDKSSRRYPYTKRREFFL